MASGPRQPQSRRIEAMKPASRGPCNPAARLFAVLLGTVTLFEMVSAASPAGASLSDRISYRQGGCLEALTDCVDSAPGSSDCVAATISERCCSQITKLRQCLEPNRDLCGNDSGFQNSIDDLEQVVQPACDARIIDGGNVELYNGLTFPSGTNLTSGCVDEIENCKSRNPLDVCQGSFSNECCNAATQRRNCYEDIFARSACASARDTWTQNVRPQTFDLVDGFCGRTPTPATSVTPTPSTSPTPEPGASPSVTPTITMEPSGSPLPASGPSPSRGPACDTIAVQYCVDLAGVQSGDFESTLTCTQAVTLWECMSHVAEDECADFTDGEFRRYLEYAEAQVEERGCNSNVCFPETAKVELESGVVKSMADVSVGDRVKVSPKQYSEVYFFSHASRDVYNFFLRLHTDANVSLTLTPSHYVLVNEGIAAARTVRVGDLLYLSSGSPVKVDRVDRVVERGLYNPHTVEGTVVVNGVRATCFTSAVRSETAGVLLAPLRLIYSWTGLSVSGILDHGVPRSIVRRLARGDSTIL